MISSQMFQGNSHQDWTTVILKPKKVENVEKQTIVKTALNKQGGNMQSSQLSKIANETEDFNHKYVSSDIAKCIISARCSKKLTQDALAKALNMPKQDIANIESCKAIYNGGQIAKIKRYLGI